MAHSAKKIPTNTLLGKAVSPVHSFMQLEASGGITLIIATVIALICANSGLTDWYFSFINTPVTVGLGDAVLKKSYLLLVNDGLMAIFFYLVGLEIKREIMVGELSTPQKASFSIFAAIGGMVIPAAVYLIFNAGSPTASGWGIPMATDIAFALGVLTLLGKGVPATLKIFLLALAIVDDLGAVMIIALFYTKEVFTSYLGYAAIFLFGLYLLNRAGLRHIVWGLVFGSLTWFCFLKSGVHATIAGVLLAFATPARKFDESGEQKSGDSLLLDDYIHALHPWVAFVIMPVFAFFNAGVSFAGVDFGTLHTNPVFIGIALGLLVGKPVGILLMTKGAVMLGVAQKPSSITWGQVTGVGFLAGIGFTMSLFIGGLAFDDAGVQVFSKMGILMGSLVSMILGYLLLKIAMAKPEAVTTDDSKAA